LPKTIDQGAASGSTHKSGLSRLTPKFRTSFTTVPRMRLITRIDGCRPATSNSLLLDGETMPQPFPDYREKLQSKQRCVLGEEPLLRITPFPRAPLPRAETRDAPKTPHSQSPSVGQPHAIRRYGNDPAFSHDDLANLGVVSSEGRVLVEPNAIRGTRAEGTDNEPLLEQNFPGKASPEFGPSTPRASPQVAISHRIVPRPHQLVVRVERHRREPRSSNVLRWRPGAGRIEV
ncbi:MAG: hypothetical protein BJ554DRAFT_1296, partial [Olpidium bornovanus]